MSMKVEIDAVDAELLSVLRKHKAASVMAWDVTLAPGVVMKVDITYPLTHSIPDKIVQAVTTCIAASIEAAKPAAKEFPCRTCCCVPCACVPAAP